ncbi:MAG: putative membrane protein [Verrucomicrobiales bacterium]|jgi:uncharacterized membrane protein
MPNLYFNSPTTFWLAAAGIAAGVMLLLLALGYGRQAGTPGVRWLCALIKFTAIGLLAAMLLEPMWTGQTAKPGSNDFLVLVDNGEGMQIQDGEQLLGELREAADTPDSWFGELEETFRVETFAFDTRLRKATGFEEIELDGQRSDFFHASKSLTQRYAKRPLAGMLVFTDGNASDAELLEDLNPDLPIYPVVVETETEFHDFSIADVNVSQTAFEDAPVTVSATAVADGMKGKAVALAILNEEGVEVARETHEFDSDQAEHPFRLRFRPVEPGVSFYTVKVAREGVVTVPELTDRNNEQTIVVDRGRGPYRVLYLTGRPNWEYKFLRRALDKDDEIQLVGLVRVAKREPKFTWRGREGESNNPLFRGFKDNLPEEEQAYDKPVLIRLNTRDQAELRDGFPKEREVLFGDYHAIVIDDLEAGFFTEDQQLLVEKFVNLRGGSVLMLGGQESMQHGDYARTPIGQMLPIYLDGLASGQTITGARLKLTREGWLEPWARLRLTEQEEEIRLAHMPAFKSLNLVKAIKPGASPVATVVDDQQREFPALVVHRFGEGRVAAMTIGDLWRWGMFDKDQHEDMDKWWRQIVRWLVVDTPDFIEIRTEWDEDSGYSRRRIAVKIRNAAFRPEENATVELLITHPGSDEPAKLFAEPSLDEPGLFTAEFACAEAGAFRVQALVDDAEGIRLGDAEAGWVWNPAAAEFNSLRANRQLLADVAERTGGRVLEMADLGDFAKSLPEMKAPITETWAEPIWHQPWIFGLVILLFALEWGLRRLNGMA